MRAAPPANATRTTSRRVRSESCHARAHNGITIPISAHARFSTLTGDEIEDRAQQGGPAAVWIGHRASSPAGSSVAALSRVYGIKNVGVNFPLFRGCGLN